MKDKIEAIKKTLEPVVRFLRPVYKIWMKIAHVIGTVNTFILMTLFYIVFIGVAKLVTLLGRKDLLDSRWKDRPSYWKRRENFQVDKKAFLKPY